MKRAFLLSIGIAILIMMKRCVRYPTARTTFVLEGTYPNDLWCCVIILRLQDIQEISPKHARNKDLHFKLKTSNHTWNGSVNANNIFNSYVTCGISTWLKIRPSRTCYQYMSDCGWVLDSLEFHNLFLWPN